MLVTGSRDLTDRATVWGLLDRLYARYGTVMVVHGDCPTGADRFARQWVHDRHRQGWAVDQRTYPAKWRDCRPDCPPSHRKRWPSGVTYCPTAGHYRNSIMVEVVARKAPAGVFAAFFLRGAANRGTSDCVAKARRARIRSAGEIWTDPVDPVQV